MQAISLQLERVETPVGVAIAMITRVAVLMLTVKLSVSLVLLVLTVLTARVAPMVLRAVVMIEVLVVLVAPVWSTMTMMKRPVTLMLVLPVEEPALLQVLLLAVALWDL